MSFLQSAPVPNTLLIEDTDSRDSGIGSDVSFTSDFDFTDAFEPKVSSPLPTYSPCIATDCFKSTFTERRTSIRRFLSFGSPASEAEDSSFSSSDSSNVDSEYSIDGSCVINFHALSNIPVSSPPRVMTSRLSSSRKRKRLTNDGSESISKRTRIGTSLECHSPTLKRMRERPIHEDDCVVESDIKTILDNCAEQENLTGDFKQACSLPCVSGKHRDLKYITPHTMRRLLDGEFEETLEHQVIDCRYPYEYDGGHIKSSRNLYTKDEIRKEFLVQVRQASNPEKRIILIFHCEFSSERGPKLARYVRTQDRAVNKDSYPLLHYPEVYVLDGGYKNFFEQCPGKCVPQSYRPMLLKEHSEDLKFYRSKAKACGGRKSRVGLPMTTRTLSF